MLRRIKPKENGPWPFIIGVGLFLVLSPVLNNPKQASEVFAKKYAAMVSSRHSRFPNIKALACQLFYFKRQKGTIKKNNFYFLDCSFSFTPDQNLLQKHRNLGKITWEESTLDGPEDLKPLFMAWSLVYQVDWRIAWEVARQESTWNHKIKDSGAGAIGICQIIPSTAKYLQINPRNLDENVEGCFKYLRMMLDRFDGNLYQALAAYNAGPSAVERANYKVPPFPETQDYVAKITTRLSTYYD